MHEYFYFRWKSKDVCTGLAHPRECATLDYIVGLEPWTQYAAYVKALTVSKSIQGGISDILYFRTDAEGKEEQNLYHQNLNPEPVEFLSTFHFFVTICYHFKGYQNENSYNKVNF